MLLKLISLKQTLLDLMVVSVLHQVIMDLSNLHHVTTLLEPIWQSYCGSISRADFWALIGKLAVEKADPTQTINIPYQYGRVDNADCSLGAGRLPNAQLGLSGLSQSFVTKLGLTLNDAGIYIVYILVKF